MRQQQRWSAEHGRCPYVVWAYDEGAAVSQLAAVVGFAQARLLNSSITSSCMTRQQYRRRSRGLHPTDIQTSVDTYLPIQVFIAVAAAALTLQALLRQHMHLQTSKCGDCPVVKHRAQDPGETGKRKELEPEAL